jgi:hypothetical protein
MWRYVAAYAEVAAKSPTFAEELAKEKADRNMRVVVTERGLRQNEERSSGDTLILFTESGYVHATVYVDALRTNDSTVAHEHGHVQDARDNSAQFLKDALKTKKSKGGPNAQQHGERLEEKRANKFRDLVMREVNNAEHEERQRRKRGKQEKKKRREDSENLETATP